MNQTVLVTASNGHLGQHVVKQLLEKGYTVKQVNDKRNQILHRFEI